MPIPSPSSVLLRTQSDERLVSLARGGSERAFEAIVERYRGPLLRAARRYLPEARAEDALQQAYIAAWSALQRGDDVRDLRAWLYRIVHNTALNQLRVSGYDYAELEDSLTGTDAPQEEMERRAVVRQTLTGLAGLPDRQRDALLRIAIEGRSQEEVARELGVTEGAVRQLVHRARMTLRAAATAVVPLPLAQLAAAAGGGGVGPPTAERIAELIAGTGAGAFAIKAGVVAVLATSTAAVAGPSIVTSGAEPNTHRSAPVAAPVAAPHDRSSTSLLPVATSTATPTATAHHDSARREKQTTARRRRSTAKTPSVAVARPRPTPTATPRATATPVPTSGSDDHSGSGSSGSGSDDHSGSGSSGSGSDDHSGSGDSSGSGSSGSGSSGSGSSGSGSDDSSGSGSSGSGSSGSGSSGSPNSGPGSLSSGPGPGPTPTATPTPAPTTSGSSGPGSGSGSSGSSGGSGPSGSGSSGGSGHGGGDD